MPKPESEPICPPKEEARIRTGIEADPDTLELDDEWFAKARLDSPPLPVISNQRARPHRAFTRHQTPGSFISRSCTHTTVPTSNSCASVTFASRNVRARPPAPTHCAASRHSPLASMTVNHPCTTGAQDVSSATAW